MMPNISFFELLRPYPDDVCIVSGQGVEQEILKEQLLSALPVESICSGPTFARALACFEERSLGGADVMCTDLREQTTAAVERFLGRLPELLNQGGRAIMLFNNREEGALLHRARYAGVYSAIAEEDLGTAWMVWLRRSLEGC